MSERARGLLDDYPLLSQRAEQYDFAERLGGSTDPLMAEIDQAMRELWMSRQSRDVPVYREVAAERERQDAKWGGAEHDDTHTADNWTAWIGFIDEHNGKAYSGDDTDEARANFRRRMVEVAALAVAAVESFDRVYGVSGDRL